ISAQARGLRFLLYMACPKSKTCSYRAAVGLGNKYVRLNVGGTLFYTTLQVLTRQDSMLKAMFSGRKEVFIDREDEKDVGDFQNVSQDRSGKHFASILTYLQGPLELLAEAKYYLIQGLVELCQGGLQVSDTERCVSQMEPYSLYSALLLTRARRILDESNALHRGLECKPPPHTHTRTQCSSNTHRMGMEPLTQAI
uniref:BTB/POZ domain-containing adapter for CUL3-mediated RhoA degradation protein 2 n=1 Tax=Oncorhynchus tshawytscha TaxID=74940 RepID=A0A8C8F3D7_ONCTS